MACFHTERNGTDERWKCKTCGRIGGNRYGSYSTASLIESVCGTVDARRGQKLGTLLIMPVHNTPNHPHISPCKVLAWREKVR